MFCAINTLLSKEDVEEALVFIDWLSQIGIDGISGSRLNEFSLEILP